jgi:hypothetical protein
MALASDPAIPPRLLEALAAIVFALEQLSAKLEGVERALRWKEDAL